MNLRSDGDVQSQVGFLEVVDVDLVVRVQGVPKTGPNYQVKLSECFEEGLSLKLNLRAALLQELLQLVQLL